MYALSEIPGYVICLETGAVIPPGHWMRKGYDDWVAEGNVAVLLPPYELYSVQHFQHIRTEAWKWMLAEVQARQYDTIESCCSYVSSSVERYRKEATAMVAWRDAVNLALEQLVVDLPAGIETWDDVRQLLPQPEQFDWPFRPTLPIDNSQEPEDGTTDQPTDLD